MLRSNKVLCTTEQKVRKLKESQLTNVEGRPVPQEIVANQDINNMGEGSSCVHQEDPSVLERQPNQKRKTSFLNCEAENEKGNGSMTERKLTYQR